MRLSAMQNINTEPVMPSIQSMQNNYNNDPTALKVMKQGDGDGIAKPITPRQRTMGEIAAWKLIQDVKNNTPYQLSQSAIKAKIDPSLTCIGGACNAYNKMGVDFSRVGNESEGVRESNTGGKVVEYNPTFDKNFAKAGFEKVKNRPIEYGELRELINNKQLNPGDIIQYYNDQGVPYHTNTVLSSEPDGGFKVYNAYKHGQASRGESKEPYIYTLNPDADQYKGKKINVFRLTDEKAKELQSNINETAGNFTPGSLFDTSDKYQLESEINRKMRDIQNDKYGLNNIITEDGTNAYEATYGGRKGRLSIAQKRNAAIKMIKNQISESMLAPNLQRYMPQFKKQIERLNSGEFDESPETTMFKHINTPKK